MKVAKQKVVEALAKRCKEREADMRKKYKERLDSELKWAQQSLDSARRSVPKEEKDLDEVKKKIAEFKSTHAVPEEFSKRYEDSERNVRIDRLMRKIAFCIGDTVNVTDGEFALL